MTNKKNKAKQLFVKNLMFISSYFPLYFMLLILHWDKFNSFEKASHPRVIIFLSAMIVCIMLSLVSVFLLKISLGANSVTYESIERPDDTIISYLMTYIIPILTTDIMKHQEVLVNVILFLLIGYLYIRLNLIYLNPLWSAFGYLPYRINTDSILITDIPCADLKSVKINANGIRTIKGYMLSDGIFVASKKNNKFQ